MSRKNLTIRRLLQHKNFMLFFSVALMAVSLLMAEWTVSAQSFTCSNDPFEPNNMDSQAHLIGSNQISFAQNLFICPTSDEDWFAKDLKQGDQLTVEVDTRPFNAGFTTLKVCILDTNAFTELACNARQAQLESMQYTIQTDGRYYVMVMGFDTGTNEFDYNIGIVTTSPPPEETVDPPDGTPEPRITGLTPNSGPPGTQVSVVGGGFIPSTILNPMGSVVIFEGSPLTTTYVDGFEVKFTVPSSTPCPSFATVRVENPIPNVFLPPVSNDMTFQVTCPNGGTTGDQVDIEIINIEMVQTIQNLDHAIPLVAGKPTVARVYVKTNGKSVPVEARLFAKLGGTSVPWYNNAMGYTCFDRVNAQSNPKLSDLRDSTQLSIDCELPQAWLNRTGTLELTAEVYIAGGTSGGYGRRSTSMTDPDESNNSFSNRATIESSPVMHLQAVQLRINGRGLNYQRDYRLIHEHAKQMYPSSNVQLHPHRTWVYWNGDVGGIINLVLGSIGLQRPGRNTTLLGVVNRNDAGSGPCGMGTPIPDRYSWVRVTPGTQGTNNFQQDCTAHEMGHSLWAWHVVECNEPFPTDGSYPFTSGNLSNGSGPSDYWGVSVSSASRINQVFSPQSTKDIMTYCNRVWISPYTYGVVRAGLRGGAGLSYKSKWPVASISSLSARSQGFADQTHETPFVTANVNAGQDYLIVVGTLDAERGEVTLGETFVLPGSIIGDEFSISEPGPYRINVLDENGSELAHQTFSVPDGSHHGEQGVFTVLIPAVSGAAQFNIEGDGGVLYSKTFGSNFPEIFGLDAQPSEEMNVNWDGNDPDGDPLTAALFVSFNGGDSWEPAAVGFEENQLDLSAEFWPGTSNAMLRLFVSDGYHTSETSFGPFEVLSKAPDVFITGPEEGTQFGIDEELNLGAVHFSAQGFDAEDGPLSGGSLSWQSDMDGFLGEGDTITAALTSGWHNVSVTAMDRDGNSNIASVQVFVSDAGDEMFGDEPIGPGQSIEQALDANGNNRLDDGEIKTAINLWISGQVVPGTSQTINDNKMKQLMQTWISGSPLSTQTAEPMAQTIQPMSIHKLSLSSQSGQFALNLQALGVASTRLQVFNLAGRTLLDQQASGNGLSFRVLDQHGNRLANGVYLYIVTARGLDGSVWRSDIKKFIVLQ